MNTAPGDAFDEKSMEVGELVVGKKDGVVVEVEWKGYRIGEKVTRRARVKVSATEETMKKAQEEEKEEGEAEEVVEEEEEEEKK